MWQTIRRNLWNGLVTIVLGLLFIYIFAPPGTEVYFIGAFGLLWLFAYSKPIRQEAGSLLSFVQLVLKRLPVALVAFGVVWMLSAILLRLAVDDYARVLDQIDQMGGAYAVLVGRIDPGYLSGITHNLQITEVHYQVSAWVCLEFLLELVVFFGVLIGSTAARSVLTMGVFLIVCILLIIAVVPSVVTFDVPQRALGRINEQVQRTLEDDAFTDSVRTTGNGIVERVRASVKDSVEASIRDIENQHKGGALSDRQAVEEAISTQDEAARVSEAPRTGIAHFRLDSHETWQRHGLVADRANLGISASGVMRIASHEEDEQFFMRVWNMFQLDQEGWLIALVSVVMLAGVLLVRLLKHKAWFVVGMVIGLLGFWYCMPDWVGRTTFSKSYGVQPYTQARLSELRAHDFWVRPDIAYGAVVVAVCPIGANQSHPLCTHYPVYRQKDDKMSRYQVECLAEGGLCELLTYVNAPARFSGTQQGDRIVQGLRDGAFEVITTVRPAWDVYVPGKGMVCISRSGPVVDAHGFSVCPPVDADMATHARLQWGARLARQAEMAQETRP